MKLVNRISIDTPLQLSPFIRLSQLSYVVPVMQLIAEQTQLIGRESLGFRVKSSLLFETSKYNFSITVSNISCAPVIGDA